MYGFRLIAVLIGALYFAICSRESISDETSLIKAENLEKSVNVANEASKKTDVGNILPWQVLPKNWKSLTAKTWRSLLGLSQSCDLTAEHEERFKHWVDLGEGRFLLLIACELGAYQDGYYTYFVNDGDNSFLPLTIGVPKFDGVWKILPQKITWGAFNKVEGKEALEVLYLSAATGMCGHRSYYSVKSLSSTSAIEPVKVFADEDCYNGVTVESWAQVK